MAFFSSFAHLGYSRFDYQESLSRSRVVLLGVGGVGSSLLYNLAGLGVGHVVALDCDAVELKNLSRQFLYAEADVGQSKIECASARALALNSEIAITSFERRVTGPDDISDVLVGADLVLAVIDQPVEVREWINTACVAARVPYITGGVTVSRGVYWSVDPGTSGCLACRQAQRHPDQAITFPTQVNRAIGPAAGLVGSLIALEAVRYLTGFAAPISAGRMWLADLVTGQTDVGYTWERRPDCPICGIEAMQRNDAVDVAAIASVAR
jgi:molybdopterin/thiamine biosynthesis adenylyltransferase